MQQKALHDDEGEPANGFDIDIDINIAQAKRSAINLCNKQAIDGLPLPPTFLCLPWFH